MGYLLVCRLHYNARSLIKKCWGFGWVKAKGQNFGQKSSLSSRIGALEDIFIACVDGLKELPDAIEAVFPKTTIQLCVIRMIRNSMKYISHKNTKEFMGSLKLIYQSKTENEYEDRMQSKLVC